MPTYVLLKGFPEYAAANIADAQNLYTALLDPATDTNALTIGRITQRLPPLCIADTAVPLVIDSIDDAAGTRSSWVTNATASLAFAIGDADPALSHRYASANISNISANTRVGNISLNTQNLVSALQGWFGHPQRGTGTQFTAHIQQTDATGLTQTYGMVPLTVLPGVFEGNRGGDPDSGVIANYVTLANLYAGYANSNAAAALTYAGNANTYAFASLGYSNNAQNYANAASNSANLANTYQGYANSNSAAAAASATSASASANTAQNYATPNGTTVLAAAANVSWNMAANVTAKLTLNQNTNITISAFSDGGTGILHVLQNASGNWTAAWAATGGNIAWPGNVAPTITTTANFRDTFTFSTDGTTLLGSYVQGYPR